VKRVATLSDLRSPQALTLEDGVAVARRRSARVDQALSELAGDVLKTSGDIAVVAQGGYGRSELSPYSDIDLLFLVGGRSETTKGTLRSVLYPLYDAGLKVGHATVSPKDAILRADADLHATTALLSARFVAGNQELFDELEHRFDRWLRRREKAIARAIAVGVDDRHAHAERAGWLLAPNLKEDAGGLRDIHSAQWLSRIEGDGEELGLERESNVLLAAREALHMETERGVDLLRIDLQSAVAKRLGLDGDDGADKLMIEVHRSAREVEHLTALFRADVLRRVLGGPRRSGSVQTVAPGVRLEDGSLRLTAEAQMDVPSVLRLLTAAATLQKPLDRKTHETARGAFEETHHWNERSRSAFFDLVASPRAAAALEEIDHAGGWSSLMPEWDRIRGRAQHDPYHRYTVDGHSFVAVQEVARVLRDDPLAQAAADEAGDLSELYLGTLLHDIGKGSGMDHSIAGEEIARTVCTRMGVPEKTVASLVRHHLLLADTATRRDIDDGAVVESVAATLGDARTVRLLYILTAADGRATGAEAWTPWKSSLVGSLYRKVLAALETGELPPRTDVASKAAELEAYEPVLAGRSGEVLGTLPPSYLESPVWDMADEIPLLLAPPEPGTVKHRIRDGSQPEQSMITICVTDRPGTLARSAGVFALHRAPVLTAQAYSTASGLALQRFLVLMPSKEGTWASLIADLEAAYGGRLALEARVEQKARDYKPATPVHADVRVLNDASDHSTVIEVRAGDALGLLYAITSAISQLDLDIHTAKIDTLGERVVDAFYVRTSWGTKLGSEQAEEASAAIRHRVQRFFES
jgi:[protein-PII] uridylyltransferase